MVQWQNDLSPLAREKLARIGNASAEEKARMKDSGDLNALLARFFKNELTVEELYRRLKEYEAQGKQPLLEEARSRLSSSFKQDGLRIRFETSAGGRLTMRLIDEEEVKGEAQIGRQDLIVELTDADFDAAVRKHRLLVVDCWAEWCAPCRMMAPIIEELAIDYKGKVTFAKLNVDQNPAVASKYGVMSIPTLLIFKDWQLVDQITGAMPRNLLEPQLAQYIE